MKIPLIDPAKNTGGSAPVNPYDTVKDILFTQLKEYLRQKGFYESAWHGYWDNDEFEGGDLLIEEGGKIHVFSLPEGMKTTVSEIKTFEDVDTLLNDLQNFKSIRDSD
jgi:hypothetical protein